jgi:asparagine synthetase B (glutamine-hydrolysing)
MAAIGERLPRSEPAVLSLSGGWDSSAVFGASQEVIRLRGRGELRAVSVSYPEGDTGREDNFILQTTARWNATPSWLQIEDIPLFRGTRDEAARRDEPFAHPFEQVNRALAAAGRALGARVMFDGYGGDQLFIASPGFLADLVREGRWRDFLRYRRQIISRFDLPTQLRYILLPILPAWMLDFITELQGGRPLRGHFQRLPAPWLRRDFSERYGLMGRQHRIFPPGQPHVPNAELRYYLTAPIGTTSVRCVSRYSFEAGMEQRSPLFDQRVIAFAAARPWEERNLRGESKRTLRRAVSGLIPDSVLAPRRHKTGTAGQYFGRIMQRDFPALARLAFAQPILPELGIVDVSILRQATDDLEAGRFDAETVSQLFFTLQTELWLQAHHGTVSGGIAGRLQ